MGIVGTWTTSTFVQLFQLAAARVGLFTTVYETGFGQYFNETLDPYSPLFREKLDAVVLCPDDRASAIPLFSETPENIVQEQVKQWTGAWDQLRKVSPLTIIQQGFVLPGTDPLGHYATSLRGSRKRVAAEINFRLAERARDEGIAGARHRGPAGGFLSSLEVAFDVEAPALPRLALEADIRRL